MSHQNIARLLQTQAKLQQDKLAFRFIGTHDNREERISFSELARSVGQLAGQLRKHAGIGDRIILLYSPGFDFIKTFYACLCAGLVAVPVSPVKSGERWEHFLKVINDSQANLICTTESGEATLQELFSTEVNANGEDDPVIDILVTSNLPLSDEHACYESDLSGDELAFLQYTSGSTGEPKGVCISHKNLLHNAETISTAYEINQNTICGSWLPIFHDMGLIWGIVVPLFSGVSAVLMSPFTFLRNPAMWLQSISKYRISHTGAPNFAYDLCVRRISDADKVALDLSCWQVAYCGAEMVRAATYQAFSDKFADAGFDRHAFYPCYGMAETTLMVSGGQVKAPVVIETIDLSALEQGKAITVNDGLDKKTLQMVSVGRAVRCEVKIVDPNSFEALKDGEIGEIWIRGDSVSRGYWNKPDLSLQTFAAQLGMQGEHYFRTGDLGYMRNGLLFISSRLKEMIILQGKNHYPTDIERVVQNANPAFRLNFGAAFSVDTGSSEMLVIVQEVVRKEMRALSREYLEGDVRMALASQLDIELGELILIRQGTLPVTSSGKIQRLKAKNMYLHDQLTPIHFDEQTALA